MHGPSVGFSKPSVERKETGAENWTLLPTEIILPRAPFTMLFDIAYGHIIWFL